MELYYVFLTLVLTASLQIQPAARIRDLRDRQDAEELYLTQKAASKLGSYVHYREQQAKAWELFETMKECHKTHGVQHPKAEESKLNYCHFQRENQDLWNQWQQYALDRSNTALHSAPNISVTPTTPRDHSSRDHSSDRDNEEKRAGMQHAQHQEKFSSPNSYDLVYSHVLDEHIRIPRRQLEPTRPPTTPESATPELQHLIPHPPSSSLRERTHRMIEVTREVSMPTITIEPATPAQPTSTGNYVNRIRQLQQLYPQD